MIMKDGLIIGSNGTIAWYLNGKFHKEDGPAIEYTHGTKGWYLNGKRHRLDGPALEWSNGYKEWWIDGQQVTCKTNEQFLRMIKLKEFW